MIATGRKIVLASGSPRRKELLKGIGLKFTIHISSFREVSGGRGRTPRAVAIHNARGKAVYVARHYKDALVIGVDTIGALRGRVFGKPRDDGHARRILRTLSGTTHEVISAVCVIDTASGRRFEAVERTKVTFAKMTREEIDWYIASGEQRDKAAAFAIQGLGSLFIKKINGDYFNVVGLPIFTLGRLLRKIATGDIGRRSGSGKLKMR
ncbi:MAG: Maf family protein [Patescibacteria group bacterium]